MSKSLFQLLNDIHNDKTPWDNLTEGDKKAFSPYMVNRFLSMRMEYTELVNDLQKYTIGGALAPREVYKLYSDILPKQKFYQKYIKSANTEKYNSELIDILTRYFKCSSSEVIEYIPFLGKEECKKILSKYGIEEKVHRKLLKGIKQ